MEKTMWRRQILLLAALFCWAFASCRTESPVSPPRLVAVAIIPDFSGSFDYIEAAGRDAQRVIGAMQPGDSIWLNGISSNSRHEVGPMFFGSRRAGTAAEIKAFLEERARFRNNVEQWFATLKAERFGSSDVCGAIHSAVFALNRSDTKRKGLIVYSDLNDNVTKRCELSLEGLDVRLLYVYPHTRRAKDYDSHADRVARMVAAGRPLSYEVLSPVQARTFAPDNFIAQIRNRREAAGNSGGISNDSSFTKEKTR